MLAPQKKKTFEVRLDLPDGHYDFISGYGGGANEVESIASNLCAFDIEGGTFVALPGVSR